MDGKRGQRTTITMVVYALLTVYAPVFIMTDAGTRLKFDGSCCCMEIPANLSIFAEQVEVA